MNKKNKILITVFGFLLMMGLVFGTTISDTISNIGGINNTGDFITKDPVYDIRAYGAIADDGLVDDIAIQLAVADAIANPGIIYFPKGVWTINQTINITKGGISLVGAGIHSTQLKRANNAICDVVHLSRESGSNFFQWSNMEVHGNYQNSDIGRGLVEDGYTEKLGDVHLINLEIWYFPNTAIYMTDAWSLVADSIIIEHIKNGNGIDIRGGEGGFISNSKFLYVNGTSIRLVTYRFNVEHNFIDSGNSSAIEVRANNNIINGNMIVDSQTSPAGNMGIHITGDANMISDNYIYGGSTMETGIKVENYATDNILMGNYIYNRSAMTSYYTDTGSNNIYMGKEYGVDGFTINTHDLPLILKSEYINISEGNITMTSPDGTGYSCGVANGGTFSCS